MRQIILIILISLIFLNPTDLSAGNNKAVDSGKASPEADYLLAISSMERGAWGEAVESLQRLSGYEPLADYALFYLAEALIAKEDLQPALSTLKKLMARFPESRWKEDAEFKTADILFRLGRYSEARSSFERFIRDNPGASLVPQAKTRIAESLKKEGRFMEAHESYKTLWLRHPTSPASSAAYLKMTGLSSKKHTGNHPPGPSIDERYGRVSLFFSAGGYKEGINELLPLLNEVEKRGPDRPKWFAEAILKLGGAYYRIREDSKAEMVLKELIEAGPLPDITADVLFLYGKVLQRSGKRAEASAAYEKIIKDYPAEGIVENAAFRMADMAEGDEDLAKGRDLYRNLYTTFPGSRLADDALWKEGWLFYREKDYKSAYALFGKLLAEYPSSEYVDTATYWSARAAEKMGMVEVAAGHYNNIINNFPLSYYTVLSNERVPYTAPEIPSASQAGKGALESPAGKEAADKYTSFHLARGKTLLDLGFKEDAAVELSLAGSRSTGRMTILEIAGLMLRAGDYNRAQRIAFKSLQRYLGEGAGRPDAEIWRLAFPAGFSDDVSIIAERNSISPYLIHAIIREESSYMPDAVSRAGAIGLMQLMPSTGDSMARTAGVRGYSTQALFIPETNIALGSLYLKRLVEANNGNLPLAIASYNAGPGAVSAWVSRYGTEDMDEFIEKIPYRETRNYVKRVLRSSEYYGRLYSAPKVEASEKVASR